MDYLSQETQDVLKKYGVPIPAPPAPPPPSPPAAPEPTNSTKMEIEERKPFSSPKKTLPTQSLFSTVQSSNPLNRPNNTKLREDCVRPKPITDKTIDTNTSPDLAATLPYDKKLIDKAHMKEYGFCWLVVGKPGSGKSQYVSKLVRSVLSGLFGHIYYFTPSEIDGLKLVQNVNWFQSFEWHQIDRCLKRSRELKPGKNVLFVFDDQIGMLKGESYTSRLKDFFFNRRHLLNDEGQVSIMVTTQKYMTCPPEIRTILTDISLFRISAGDFKVVFKEHIFTDSKMVPYLIDEHWKKNEHNTIHIDCQKSTIWAGLSNQIG